MWLAILFSFFWVFFLYDKEPHLLSFDRQTWFGMDKALWGILFSMLVILVVGIIDDLKGLHWSSQLGGQFLVGLILVLCGVTIPYVRSPFDGLIVFSPFWSGSFTILWVMMMINVMNWFDGLDGLAGSITLTASVALFFVSLQVGVIGTATLSLILAATAAGFLVWNWYPSKLFMGTVGSQLLGMMLAVIAIISGGKVATAVLVLGIPLLDAGIVVCRRLYARQSPFIADQRHLHHRLLKIGLPVPYVVLLINVVALIFGMLAVTLPNTGTKGLLGLVLVGCMILFILVTYLLEQRAKKKVD
jgi:UDP-GlcNAc:undecaprenyl-phosphate GlcNAc-1-phosphate transferase